MSDETKTQETPETPVEEQAIETPVEEAETTETQEEAAPMEPDDEKKTGIKEAAVNSEVIAIEQKKEEDEEKVAAPSFFVDKEDRHRVTVDILCKRSTGKILSISREGLGINFGDYKLLTHVVEWFDFTMPSYDELANYRQRCGIYRKEAQKVLVDPIQLRNFLLVWHLKDWSLRDRDDNKVTLDHEDAGSLTDESIDKVYATHPTIIDIAMTIFEKDLLLT